VGWGLAAVGSRGKARSGGPGTSPPEVDDTFYENVLVCHGFKNDIAILHLLPTSVQYEMEQKSIWRHAGKWQGKQKVGWATAHAPPPTNLRDLSPFLVSTSIRAVVMHQESLSLRYSVRLSHSIDALTFHSILLPVRQTVAYIAYTG